jgi:Leu/Phe-tRNA-protein transferase
MQQQKLQTGWWRMQEIYKITPELLRDENYLFEYIYKNMKNNYYWSDEWSEELYIELAKRGFIATSYDTLEGLVLLPEIQFAYAVLFFEKLHISQKVKKLLQKDDYILSFNSRFDEVLDALEHFHKYNWLKGEYRVLLERLKRGAYENFSVMSVELSSKESGELIAGEVGYVIGRTYTSLSGFSSREKAYKNCGSLQLVLLAQHLQKEGFAFWNLGHPYMEYKKRLGAEILEREKFLELWNREITRSRNE